MACSILETSSTTGPEYDLAGQVKLRKRGRLALGYRSCISLGSEKPFNDLC